MEKNWNYCITYPSSSTTEGFDDIINQYNGALKAVYFDENTRADSGAMQLVIYSKAKHGLSEGDTVNIYKTYKEDKKTVNENDANLVNAIDFINQTKLENQPTEETIKPQLSEEDQRSQKTRRVLKTVIWSVMIVSLLLFCYVIYSIYQLLN